ncbi:MAG: hypothetical protein ACE5H3_02165 [Planctomycetota bacterium]
MAARRTRGRLPGQPAGPQGQDQGQQAETGLDLARAGNPAAGSPRKIGKREPDLQEGGLLRAALPPVEPGAQFGNHVPPPFLRQGREAQGDEAGLARGKTEGFPAGGQVTAGMQEVEVHAELAGFEVQALGKLAGVHGPIVVQLREDAQVPVHGKNLAQEPEVRGSGDPRGEDHGPDHLAGAREGIHFLAVQVVPVLEQVFQFLQPGEDRQAVPEEVRNLCEEEFEALLAQIGEAGGTGGRLPRGDAQKLSAPGVPAERGLPGKGFEKTLRGNHRNIHCTGSAPTRNFRDGSSGGRRGRSPGSGWRRRRAW